MKREDRATKGAGDGAEVVPLFGTWRRAYALAVGLFAVESAVLYAFTRYFS